jgi:predicted ThiF/HesA family dinucleotide-utilizing enzyme
MGHPPRIVCGRRVTRLINGYGICTPRFGLVNAVRRDGAATDPKFLRQVIGIGEDEVVCSQMERALGRPTALEQRDAGHLHIAVCQGLYRCCM